MHRLARKGHHHGVDLEPSNAALFYQRVRRKHGMRIEALTDLRGLEHGSATLVDVHTGEERRLAAEFKGDFQEMSVRAFSELTYYSALSWRRLGKRMTMLLAHK